MRKDLSMLVDLYEIAMANGLMQSGNKDIITYFDMFFRHVPDDGGFAIKITEKIEDFVSGIFVPIFFALSGLNTNLGLLNDGITWAYVIAVILIAFITKIIGGALAARLTGRQWRESFSIGVLMSCKGLVELIVLVSSSIIIFVH